jgi:SOS response regulatory protein OraA/RecX
VTNVTYLPWVSPEHSDSGDESVEDSSPESLVQPQAQVFSEVFALAPESESPEVADLTSVATFDIDQLEQALIRKLHAADMSAREVHTWLSSRDAPEADALKLIDKFIRLGYIDDQRMARQLVDKLTVRKGKCKNIIVNESLDMRDTTLAFYNCLQEGTKILNQFKTKSLSKKVRQRNLSL